MKNVLISCTIILLSVVSCQIPEPSDVTPPVMQIIYPNEGAVISGDFDIIINAVDDDGVQKVWCYVNGIEIGEATSKPYSIPFSIAGLEKKANYVVQAMAIDLSGNTGNSEQVNFTIADSPDLTPPTIQILNPQSGQVVENSVRVLTDPHDDIGIQKVAFFIDGDSVGVSYTYPYAYTWETSGYSDSTEHSITAKAVDTGGNSSFSPVSVVTVYPRSRPADDVIPPVITFIYPIEAMNVSGSVNVSADIRDNSAISKAEFFVDGVLTFSEDNPDIPWNVTWNSSPDSLQHTLYIRAFDTANNIGSNLISVISQ